MRSVLVDSIAEGYSFLSLPFLYKDATHYLEVANSEKFKSLVRPILEENGIIVLSDGWCGARDLYATRPIHNLEELRGLKIRTIGIPVIMESWRALGAIPTPVSWTELYNALETGIVEAGEGSIVSFLANKFYEAGANNLTIVQMQTVPIPLIVSKKTWDKLPQKYRESIKIAAKEWSEDTKKVIEKEFEGAYKEAEKRGVNILEIKDISNWKEKVLEAQDNYAKKLGEGYIELLNWIRNQAKN